MIAQLLHVSLPFYPQVKHNSQLLLVLLYLIKKIVLLFIYCVYIVYVGITRVRELRKFCNSQYSYGILFVALPGNTFREITNHQERRPLLDIIIISRLFEPF